MSLITKPMLADAIEDDVAIKFPVLASPKYDGIRCLVIGGKILSRTFKDIPNRFVQEVMKKANLPEELDGELIIDGMSFNEIQSIIMSEDKVKEFKFYVFDYVSTSLTEEYEKRVEKLKTLKLPAFCEKVVPKLIHSRQELSAYHDECVANGFEGAMIRSVTGPYKCGRSSARQGYLNKVKLFKDSEAEVVGFVEQMHNENEAEEDAFGRTKRSKAKAGLTAAGTLGKLIVREIGNTPWKGKEFGVGTGFDHAQKQEIWDNQAKYLGKVITYKYQEHGIKDLPRLPVWKGFRDIRDFGE